MANALEKIDIFGSVVIAPPQSSDGFEMRKTLLPKSEDMLRNFENARDFADGAKGFGVFLFLFSLVPFSLWNEDENHSWLFDPIFKLAAWTKEEDAARGDWRDFTRFRIPPNPRLALADKKSAEGRDFDIAGFENPICDALKERIHQIRRFLSRQAYAPIDIFAQIGARDRLVFSCFLFGLFSIFSSLFSFLFSGFDFPLIAGVSFHDPHF